MAPNLARSDFNSITWMRLSARIRLRIAELHEINVRPQNTETQTATLRGRIMELKDLLALETATAEDAGPE